MAADVATSPDKGAANTDTGGFSFFRKYQKHILYTAVLFALLTFSIPVALTSFFDPTPEFKGPTMQMGARTIHVTEEDWMVGRMIVRRYGDPSVVLPDIATGDDRDDLSDRFAALRRLAIESGIEVSDVEVERAIEQAVKIFPQIDTKAQIARNLGYSSLEAYRVRVREALRIGMFLRLQVASVDTLDAAVVKDLLDGREKVVLTVASFDKSAEEESLKAKGVTDKDLKTWVNDLPEAERRAFEDPNRVALQAVGIVVDEFDRTQFGAELEGVEFSEAELKVQYERRKDRLFRRPVEEAPKEEGDDGGEEADKGAAEETKNKKQQGEAATEKKNEGKGGDGGQEPGVQSAPVTEQAEKGATAAQSEQAPEPQAATEQPGQEPAPIPPAPPRDDYFPFEEVKDVLEARLFAEALLDKLRFGAVEAALAEHMLPAIEARNAAIVATASAREGLADAEEKLADDPEDGKRKDAVETAEAAVETAEEAEESAATAIEDRRREFDFAAQMAALIGDREGFTTHGVAEPVESSELEALGPLGSWNNAPVVETMDAAGELSVLLQTTDKACFHFQIADLVKKPVKPFEEIAEQARGEYYVKKADEAAEAGSEKLEEVLLEKAKEQIAAEVAELEKDSAAGVEKDFSAWQAERQSEYDQAVKERARFENRQKSRIFQRWEQRVAELRELLDKQDEKRSDIEEKAGEELEDEIEKEARKVYKDVLEAAIADTGFSIGDVGPYVEDLSSTPRFQHRFSEKVRFLWGNDEVRGLKADEVTDLLDDVTGRAKYMVVCKSRDKVTADDLTRREIHEARAALIRDRLTESMKQSFSLEALEERWGYVSPQPRLEEEAKPKPGTEETNGSEAEESKDPDKK